MPDSSIDVSCFGKEVCTAIIVLRSGLYLSSGSAFRGPRDDCQQLLGTGHPLNEGLGFVLIPGCLAPIRQTHDNDSAALKPLGFVDGDGPDHLLGEITRAGLERHPVDLSLLQP